jgi:hypothetical protein
MKTFYILVILTACLTSCFTPDKKPTLTPGPESATCDTADDAFHWAKVKAMVDTVHKVEDTLGGDDAMAALDEKTYASLTLDEKFAYNILNDEEYAQNCDILPEHKDLAHRIYATPPPEDPEAGVWSERQINFFKNNKDSVTALLKALISCQKSVDDQYKEIIVILNATSLIPLLIDTYKTQPAPKDHYILSVLMELMDKNKFPEFIGSISHKKLYADDAKTYSAYLDYNQANEDLIFQRAMRFYNGLPAK